MKWGGPELEGGEAFNAPTAAVSDRSSHERRRLNGFARKGDKVDLFTRPGNQKWRSLLWVPHPSEIWDGIPRSLIMAVEERPSLFLPFLPRTRLTGVGIRR